MEIGHANLNFGNMEKNERRTKRIVIRNPSEVPLLYRILKSGSIASGDLRFSEGKSGIVRGYSKREVEFEFEPSLPGLFQEKLIIENIQNPSNNQTVIVKANIKQPQNFYISNVLLDFGPSLVDQNHNLFQDIVISNPSAKQTKTFEVRVDPQDLKYSNFIADISFSIPEDEDEYNICKGSSRQKIMITKETEEQIEQLEQKLKIAERKRQDHKIQKISEQLRQLAAGKADSLNASPERITSPPVEVNSPRERIISPFEVVNSSPVESENPSEQLRRIDSELSKGRPNSAQKIRRADYSIIFPLVPRGIRTVKVHFRPISYSMRNNIDQTSDITRNEASEICSIKVYVNEHKNMDVMKFVTLRSLVFTNPKIYQQSNFGNDNQKVLDIGSSYFSEQIITKPNISSECGSSLTNSLMRAEAAAMMIGVETANIDLGRIELNELKECYLTILNLCDQECEFELYSQHVVCSFNN